MKLLWCFRDREREKFVDINLGALCLINSHWCSHVERGERKRECRRRVCASTRLLVIECEDA